MTSLKDSIESSDGPSGEPFAGASRFGRFQLRPAERQLLYDERPLPLGSRAFEVLQALVARRDRVVSRNELLEIVWPDVVVEENNLTVQISALRKLLGPQAIATVPGRGYRFVAPLQGGLPAADETAFMPPAKVGVGVPTALPSLVGRERDLVALLALLFDHRLVTVTGAGGIGKTSLARWAVRAADSLDAAWVELGACTEAGELPVEIMRATGVQIGMGEPVDGLVAALAGRQMLLALDSAEHLLADVAAVAKALLAGAPGIRLLVTSQAPLHLPGEALLRLESLAVPAATDDLDEARECGAVALFIQRAREVRPGFGLDAGNVVTVVDLCRRLGGMPLAIELAAARMGAFGVHELSHLLDARLNLLRQVERRAPPRQHTLHAALDWSHALLDEAEQRVFRRLGVFVGRFTMENAGRVAADETLDEWAVIDALASLVERSLVVVEHGGPTRYRLLDTPRLYAQGQLGAVGELDAARSRHVQAMRSHFEQADAACIDGLQPVDAWRASLAPDLDDGLAAFRWALAQGDADSALSLAACIDWAMVNAPPRPQRHGVWYATLPLVDLPSVTCAVSERWLRGLMNFGPPLATGPQWSERLARAVKAAAARGDRRSAYALLRQAFIAWTRRAEMGTLGLEELRASIAQMRSLEDPEWPPVLRYLRMRAEAEACRIENDYSAAIDWFRIAVELAIEAGDSRAVHSARVALVDTELAAGLTEQALIDSALTIDALRGSPAESTLAHALLNRASALIACGRLAEAREVARRDWPRVERFGLVGVWTDVLALLLALEGRAVAAGRLLGSRYAESNGEVLPRQVNEQRAAARSEQMVRQSLGDGAATTLLRSGVAMSSKQVLQLVLEGSDRGSAVTGAISGRFGEDALFQQEDAVRGSGQ